MQNTVNAGDGVLHNHAVFAHEHQLGQRQGDDRRDDDVKEQIKSEIMQKKQQEAYTAKVEELKKKYMA